MPKSATEQELETARAALPGRRSTLPRVAWLIGPALVAGVAYLDPGNVASNMTAGAMYGYLLVWVVVLGNVMAWLIQYLSAKLGIVTGRSLPETLGHRIRNRWARRAYWLQARAAVSGTTRAPASPASTSRFSVLRCIRVARCSSSNSPSRGERLIQAGPVSPWSR